MILCGGCRDSTPRPAKIISMLKYGENGVGALFQTADGQRFKAKGYWGDVNEIILISPGMLQGMPNDANGERHWRSGGLPPIAWEESPTTIDAYIRRAMAEIEGEK